MDVEEPSGSGGSHPTPVDEDPGAAAATALVSLALPPLKTTLEADKASVELHNAAYLRAFSGHVQSTSDLSVTQGRVLQARMDETRARQDLLNTGLALVHVMEDPRTGSVALVQELVEGGRSLRAQIANHKKAAEEAAAAMKRIQARKPPRASPTSSAGGACVALKVYLNRRRASDQAASKLGKIGPSSLPSLGFDPTDDQRVWRALVPSEPPPEPAQLKAPPALMDGVMLNAEMRAAQENGSTACEGVASHFAAHLERLYAGGAAVRKQWSLRDLGIPQVYTTPDSKPDEVWGFSFGRGDFVPMHVREFKWSAASCLEALPQALVSGQSIAVGLLMHGVSAEDVVVPVDVATGKSVQFAAVFIAGGRIPLPAITSEEIDVSCVAGAARADQYYRATAAHRRHLASLLEQADPSRAPADGVDVVNIPRALYCKENGVTHRMFQSDDKTFAHVMRVFSRLHDAGLRDNVCLPLGFCRIERAVEQAGAAGSPTVSVDRSTPVSCTTLDLVFPNLVEVPPEGADPPFNLFAPSDWETAKRFVSALEAVVSRIHAAGVVHGDLYLSNVAWRCRRDVVQDKVLDLDTGFFFEKGVPVAFKEQWSENPKCQGHDINRMDLRELDLFMLRVMRWAVSDNSPKASGWSEWQRAALAADVGMSNAAFYDLQGLYLAASGEHECAPA